jgi:hypothetical protein
MSEQEAYKGLLNRIAEIAAVAGEPRGNGTCRALCRRE